MICEYCFFLVKPIEINSSNDGVQQLNYDSSTKESSKNVSDINPIHNNIASNQTSELNKYCQTSEVYLNSQYAQADFSNNTKSNTNSSIPSSFLTSENVSSSFEYVKCDSSKIEKQNKERKIKTEVELGMKLLCSLIESNNLSMSQKKKLAKSIVKRLTKNDNIDNILTSCSDSISETSLMKAKSFLFDLNDKSNCKKETDDGQKKFTYDMASQTSQSLLLKANCTIAAASEPLKQSNKINIDNGYYNVVTHDKLNENFETRLKNIESELMKMNFYKKKLLASDNNSTDEGTLKHLRERKHSPNNFKQGKEILEKETLNYQENVYNPIMNYKRSAHKNVQRTVLYDGLRKTHHCSTNIKINEKHSIMERDERLKLRTPSSSLLSSTQCTTSYELETNNLINHREYKQTAPSNHYSEPTAFEKVLPKYYIYETISTGDTSDVVLSYSCSSSQPECLQQKRNTKCIQTNDSVDKTLPIYEIKLNMCGCKNAVDCCHKNPYRLQSKHNQQVQVKPSSLAYVIEFKTKIGSDTNSSYNSEESLTLQDFLRHEKPDFYFKANQRQQILNEIRSLRCLRNEQIRNIIANESDMEKIEQELKHLPPEPMSKLTQFSAIK